MNSAKAAKWENCTLEQIKAELRKRNAKVSVSFTLLVSIFSDVKENDLAQRFLLMFLMHNVYLLTRACFTTVSLNHDTILLL